MNGSCIPAFQHAISIDWWETLLNAFFTSIKHRKSGLELFALLASFRVAWRRNRFSAIPSQVLKAFCLAKNGQYSSRRFAMILWKILRITDDTVIGWNFEGSRVSSSFGISVVRPAHSSEGQQPAYIHRLKSEINSPRGMLDTSDSLLPPRPG